MTDKKTETLNKVFQSLEEFSKLAKQIEEKNKTIKTFSTNPVKNK